MSKEFVIRIVEYPISGRKDAFVYNFIEGVSRAAGWGFVIGLVLLIVSLGPEGEDDTLSDASVSEATQ